MGFVWWHAFGGLVARSMLDMVGLVARGLVERSMLDMGLVARSMLGVEHAWCVLTESALIDVIR